MTHHDHKNGVNRRDFLHHAGAAGIAPLVAAGVASMTACAQAQQKKRNIIFILIDDLRYDFLSCLGHPWIKTPHIDKLATNGTIFENAFVTTSLCSPSRASILSGQYAHLHQVLDNSTNLPANTPVFPTELQKNGYTTAFVGKFHMGGDSDEPRPGFDHWVSFKGQGVYYDPELNINGERQKIKGYTTDLLTDHACDFIRNNKEHPFFCYLSHKAVHAEFEPAERHKGMYKDLQIPKPVSYADTDKNYAGKPDWVRRQRNSWHGVDGCYDKQVDFDQFIREYSECMLAVDESVGKVADTLQELGLLDDTLILFMGDNGFMFGEHGLIDKRAMYEPSMRVPCVAHCPSLLGTGQRRKEMMLNIDIAPTILDAAGVKIPGSMHGKSALPLIAGNSLPDWRTEFVYEYFWDRWYPQTPSIVGLRTDQHSYIRYHGWWSKNELYDILKDPDQMHNLLGHIDYTTQGGRFDDQVRRGDPALWKVIQDYQQRINRIMTETGGRPEPTWKA